MRVKICGITNLADALVAVEAGADALGFIFYDKSLRRISVRHAKQIIQQLPLFVEKVGVFVNTELSEIESISRALKLTAVQLVGEHFSASQVKRVTMPVIKTFRVNPQFNACVACDFLKRTKTTTVLLDTYDAKQYGGTGKTIDIEQARALVKDISEFGYVILAGGLNPENVETVVRYTRPYAVDVASGVEKEAGKKDHDKVRAFITKVKSAR
jgi:phosphoribosylanthranilate isomerase